MARKKNGPGPEDQTEEYIDYMKKLIRKEKGHDEPIPAPEIVDWRSLTHLLECDVDDGE